MSAVKASTPNKHTGVPRDDRRRGVRRGRFEEVSHRASRVLPVSGEYGVGSTVSNALIASAAGTEATDGQPLGPKRSTRIRAVSAPTETRAWLMASANELDPHT
jgi:hypothetical protein